MSAISSVFKKPAGEVVAGIAGTRLDEMEDAYRRLLKGGDSEALHDVRVAMRRFRSLLRAYPDTLVFPEKKIKRLKKLARGTNAARDAEVRLAWLEGIGQALPVNARPGLGTMLAQTRCEVTEAYGQVDADITAQIPDWIDRARKRLKKVVRDDGQVFGALFGMRLLQALRELEEHLGRLDTDEGLHEAHTARIAGKRVRYLIEGVAEQVRGGKQLIKKMKALQDQLGDIHDAQVRLAWLQQQAPALGGQYIRERLDALIASDGRSLRIERPDPVVSLMAVARLTLKQRRTLFREVLAQQRKGQYQALLDALQALAEQAHRAA